jgi:hypothetical protein
MEQYCTMYKAIRYGRHFFKCKGLFSEGVLHHGFFLLHIPHTPHPLFPQTAFWTPMRFHGVSSQRGLVGYTRPFWILLAEAAVNVKNIERQR